MDKQDVKNLVFRAYNLSSEDHEVRSSKSLNEWFEKEVMIKERIIPNVSKEERMILDKGYEPKLELDAHISKIRLKEHLERIKELEENMKLILNYFNIKIRSGKYITKQ